MKKDYGFKAIKWNIEGPVAESPLIEIYVWMTLRDFQIVTYRNCECTEWNSIVEPIY